MKIMKKEYKCLIKKITAYITISFFILILVCVTVNAQDEVDPVELLKQAQQQFELVDDYTATFIRRPLVDGELVDKQ